MELQASVLVNRPSDRVFALWSEAERYPEWFEMSVERRKLTDGPMRVGSRYTAVDRLPFRRRLEAELEITAYEPSTHIAATLSRPTSTTWVTTFEEVGGGTRMTFTCAVEPAGLAGLLTPLFKWWANRQLRTGLDRFKAAAEAS